MICPETERFKQFKREYEDPIPNAPVGLHKNGVYDELWKLENKP